MMSSMNVPVRGDEIVQAAKVGAQARAVMHSEVGKQIPLEDFAKALQASVSLVDRWYSFLYNYSIKGTYRD